MRFLLYTNALSEHQIPLAREIVEIVGLRNFRYIYTSKRGQKLQNSRASEEWIRYVPIGDENFNEHSDDKDWIENADVMLVGGIRPIDLMERRLANGRTTLYMSERWFKPIHLLGRIYVPGWLRLIYPRYRRVAKRFARLFKNHAYRFLPIGPWSLRDMRLICRVMDVCIPDKQVIKWGDFVAKGGLAKNRHVGQVARVGVKELKVLWVGRFLDLKRVDTIIRAVGELSKRVNSNSCCSSSKGEKFHSPTPTSNSNSLRITLDIYGTGPEESRLKQLAAKYGDCIKFHPPVSIEEVRKLMREHDVYVLASNACEGWGAVVNEALEEGMRVIGTYEAGASAAILPESNLFHSGDWRSLADRLSNAIPYIPIGDWSAKRAAERLFQELNYVN